MEKRLNLPAADWSDIKAGDEVLLSGVLYVGRDQVHQRLDKVLKNGEQPPFDFSGNAIYYMGPSPAPDGKVIGSCGPTTSARMDPFSPYLLSQGLKIMVGKGPRSQAVLDAIKEYGGLYLQAYGGCGALYAQCVRSSELVAYPEFGPEALLKLEIEDFPVFCLVDSTGTLFARK